MDNAHISSVFEFNEILPLSQATKNFFKSKLQTLRLTKNEFLVEKGALLDKICVV